MQILFAFWRSHVGVYLALPRGNTIVHHNITNPHLTWQEGIGVIRWVQAFIGCHVGWATNRGVFLVISSFPGIEPALFLFCGWWWWDGNKRISWLCLLLRDNIFYSYNESVGDLYGLSHGGKAMAP